MRKKVEPPVVKKITTYLSEDGSVELYSLICGNKTETYLRRGFNIEKVEGEVSLKFKPEPPECMDLTRTDSSGWTQQNGLKVVKAPKNLR